MPDEEQRPEEPTAAYRPYGDEEPTRMAEPIPPYAPEHDPYAQPSYTQSTSTSTGAATPGRNGSIAAPLVTVALLSILLGIGLGYLLFHDSSDSSGDEATTTLPSTTTTLATTTSEASTSTTRRSSTTTTEEESTTSTTRATTSTTRATTTSTAG